MTEPVRGRSLMLAVVLATLGPAWLMGQFFDGAAATVACLAFAVLGVMAPGVVGRNPRVGPLSVIAPILVVVAAVLGAAGGGGSVGSGHLGPW